MKNLYLILSLLLYYCPLQSATFYVSPDGLNGASGSSSDPFFLIQEAVDNCISGNDTIYLTEGTYWQSVAIFEKDGIYLSSADALTPATISGSGVEGLNMITIENSNSIYIANLIIREKFLQDANAVYVVGEGDGIYLIDNEIFNIGWTDNPEADPEAAVPVGQAHAILINGRTEDGIRNIYVGRNYFHNIVAGNSECLTLTGNTYDFLIEDNLIEDVTNIGIDIAGHFSWAFPAESDQSLNQARSGRIKTNTVRRCRRPTAGNDPAAIYVDGGKDVIIDNNRVFDNGTGISVGCENFDVTASGVKVVNNLLYNNDKFGVVFGANAGLVENSVFRNNTLFNNGVFFDNSGSIALQKSANSAILNNIVYLTSEDYFGLSLFGYVVSDLEINHNVFFSPDGNTPRVFAFNPGEGSSSSVDDPIFADPLFSSTDQVEPDFHLLEGSPAVDSGSENIELVPLERDMDGTERQVSGIDIGAYESDFVNRVSTQDIIPITAHPNPSSGRFEINFPESNLVKSARIYDSSGRLIKNFSNFNGERKSIEINGIAGFYLLQVEWENGSFSRIKLIKE